MATSALACEPVPRRSVQLRLTAAATIEVCAAMQGITLDLSGDPFLFSTSYTDYLEVGTCISIHGAGINWNLAIFCSEACCKQLVARMMGGMPKDIELDDMVDGFGEILNIIAGVAKRKIPSNDSTSITIGLPQFLDDTDCVKYFSTGADTCCQLLSDSSSNIEVVVAWKEDNPL